MSWAIPTIDPPERPRALSLLARVFDHRNRQASGAYRIPTTMAADDVAFLSASGLLPRAPERLTHDEAVARLREARETVTIAEGAAALVASLDGDEPPHGCFVEAALLSHQMPEHTLQGSKSCRVCGLGPTVDHEPVERFFAWHTAGSGVPGAVDWALLALSQLRAAPRPEPTTRARALLAHLLRALDTQPPDATPSAACAALEQLGLDRSAARGLLGTLAFAGVLEAPPHVGLLTRFVSYAERDARPHLRCEDDAPLGFWRGAHGVTWPNAEALFGVKQASRLPRLPPRAAPPAARPRAPAPGKAKGLARRPPRPGDVWALRVREDAWALVHVWSVAPRGGRDFALCEYLVGLHERCPQAPPATLRTQPRHDGRWQYHVSGLEKTAGAALIAEGVAAPESSSPAPTHIAAGNGKDMQFQAAACFRELRG